MTPDFADQEAERIVDEFDEWIQDSEPLLSTLAETELIKRFAQALRAAYQKGIMERSRAESITKVLIAHFKAKGFSAGVEASARVAFDHWCTDACDVDAQVGGGGCNTVIRVAILSLQPPEKTGG